MSIKTKIELKKIIIIPELYEWAETFEREFEEDGEQTDEPYELVYRLAKNLEMGLCSTNDYKNILFHIDQINYNEIKIQL